ncbi:hypothetical protein [Microvirga arsenatis]|uniref:Minor tail protein n=1 Tax=Microvirga arsenatis TaxID=2692265 RepID=A0ABW9YVG1_9HYPH|nr:hypothetical protein [Microvirga arsenatis]NBJ13356.1 hypothetical protein [Microvirga arsenatis]NBJ24140.1 hypothetical protein [Microvirga arsenatis]
MALDPSYFFYNDGTITLTNGSDIATGELVAWDPAVLPFDFVFPNNGVSGMAVIKEVLAVDQIKLAAPWSGPTLTDVPYFMVRWTKHTDPRVYALRVSEYLTRIRPLPEVGPPGWSPIIAVVADGARRVLQVIDWTATGTTYAKPPVGRYIGATGLVTDIAQAIDIRGPQGVQGIQGLQGLQGAHGGAFAMELTFSAATASTDPGAGKVRLNHATASLATQIFIDLVDKNGADWSAALSHFNQSTSDYKSYIRLTHASDPTKWILYYIWAETAVTGFKRFSIVHVSSSAASPFVDNDPVVLTWTRNGDKGTTGDKGWSPVFSIVSDSARRVLQVTDWVGGAGTKPATGSYVGSAGLVSDIAQAVDIRGPAGPAVGANSVDNTLLADMATGTIKGRVSSGTGDPEDLTGAQAAGIMPVVRYDAAQALTEAQKQQARDNTGLIWRPLQRITLGADVAAIDISIPAAARMIRITGALQWTVGTSAALGMRFSFDNGATYKAGATDYKFGVLYGSGSATPAHTSLSADRIQLTTTALGGNVPPVIEALIANWSANRLIGVSGSGGLTDGNSDIWNYKFSGYYPATAALTNVRLFATSGNLKSSSELIVEYLA